jgi:DNA-binding response OmpR family regulator
MTKILIVEDEAGLRQGLEINLRHENYETARRRSASFTRRTPG